MIVKPLGAPRAFVLVSALLGSACAEPSRATAPVSLATATGGTMPYRATALERTQLVAAGLAATVRVTPDGGTLALPTAGVVVSFPAGAVAVPLDITIRSASSRWVAYEFEPHGLRFAKPVTVRQTLNGTRAATDVAVRRDLRATYVAAGFDESAGGLVLADEVVPVTVDELGRSVSFGIAHFSGYQLASGRSKSDSDKK